MTIPRLLRAACAVFLLAGPTLADTAAVTIEDAYARASTPSSTSGAAFMVIRNSSDTDDRLLAARSSASERVELHTHLEDANGIMRMIEVEDGIAIPAGDSHALQRGGDHVMFMGLTQSFEQGARIPVTLIFENAGEVTIDIPVDLDRAPGHGQDGM